mgnify:CR=1 FL=1
MNNMRKALIVIFALVVVIVVSALVYTAYKGRVDPNTGEMAVAEQPQPRVLAARTDKEGKTAAGAPDFAMEDEDGNQARLADYQGKPVVLNLWASWCSYCKSEMPYFESAYQTYGDEIHFIMLNPVKSEKSPDDGRDFIAKAGYSFPVYYETAGQVLTLYGLRSFPATLFIDKEGNLVKKQIGAITQTQLEKAIQVLLDQA